jgi:hypothetical protein
MFFLDDSLSGRTMPFPLREEDHERPEARGC